MATEQEDRIEWQPVLIRPPMRHEDVEFRGRGLPARQRREIRKALRTLHSLETMAVAIYRLQIGRAETELNRQLIAAMCNEMTHQQDFQTRLYEYGMSPSPVRLFWWGVGVIFGLVSRLGGRKAILRMGIWVESKAVHHYSQLLSAGDWDEATRAMIAKDQADEQGHIGTWRRLREAGESL